MLEKLFVAGCWLYAADPNMTNDDIDDIITHVSGKDDQRDFMMVDLAPSKQILSLIQKLESIGGRLKVYVDHHLDSRRKDDSERAIQIAARPSLSHFRFVDRRNAASCISLIKFGEAFQCQAQMVFFHHDHDGFLTAIKAINGRYAGMKDDADILDGGRQGSTPLSNIGLVMANAVEHLVPRYTVDQVGHIATKQTIYERLAAHIIKGESIDDLAAEAMVAAEAAKRNARSLVMETKLLLGGVAYATFMPYIQNNEPLDIGLWKRLVLQYYKPRLLASLGTGHLGQQIYIELPKGSNIDLRDYLPDGVEGRVPFRVQVTVDRWPEFLANWVR